MAAKPSPDFIVTCEAAARAGARVLVEKKGTVRAREKGPRDLVTEADHASQAAIREVVLRAHPQHAFLGEEDPPAWLRAGENGPDDYCWVVDPLDGTTNYVHGLPGWCVSVAVVCGGRMLAGVVYDPDQDECYSATAGGGARLNGERLRTSGCPRLGEALVAASFPANVQRGSPEIERFLEVLFAAQSVRRLGSAALNLCYVASGRLDAYWASAVQPWDVAAAALILREAGGSLTGMDGEPFDVWRPQLAAAATGPLHGELVATLRKGALPRA